MEPVEPIEQQPDDECYQAMWSAYQVLKRNKPNDRSGKDKHYAVTLTQLREALGHFHHWVIVQEGDE